MARRSFELRGGGAAQGRGRRAASAEAFDVHEVCLYGVAIVATVDTDAPDYHLVEEIKASE